MSIKLPLYFSQRTNRCFIFLAVSVCLLIALSGCAAGEVSPGKDSLDSSEINDVELTEEQRLLLEGKTQDAAEAEQAPVEQPFTPRHSYENLNLAEDYRQSFVHGEKPAEFQKYIMLHDTEGEADPSSVINWWDQNGNLVAAHFIVGKDGQVVQCVPLDKIAHHAGFGDTGHNAAFGVEDESRDDRLGTSSIGSWAADYGMNSYSIGIEIVHVGGSGDYPQAQLEALDALIAYIDDHYGFESEITDHKAWRSGNSDTSPEFAPYLENYKTNRSHN